MCSPILCLFLAAAGENAMTQNTTGPASFLPEEMRHDTMSYADNSQVHSKGAL